MYESSKKENKKSIKILIKPSLKSSKKISNIKEEETQYKYNQLENSFSENIKNKMIHENKLKEIELLKKELNDIEIENDLILKEMSIIKNKTKKLEENYNNIKNEVEQETDELGQLKEINSSKKREYLELSRLRRENMNNNIEHNQNNNNSSRTNSENDNYENDRIGDIFNGINFLLNISRLRRVNEEENDESIRLNSMSEDNNEEGPAMTTQQLQA